MCRHSGVGNLIQKVANTLQLSGHKMVLWQQYFDEKVAFVFIVVVISTGLLPQRDKTSNQTVGLFRIAKFNPFGESII